MKFILRGKPKSTSHIYKMVCRGAHPQMYLSAEGKALREDYQWQARMQHKGEPMQGLLVAEVVTYHGTRRVSDWDNFHKLSMDALTGIAYEDDSQIEDALVRRRYDKEDPRIEITLVPFFELPFMVPIVS